MGFFGAMKEKAGKGLDWGKAAASNAFSTVADKAAQAETWIGEKADQAGKAALDKVHSTAREKAAQAVKDKDLLNSLDRRRDFKSKTIQTCTATSGPPVAFDGYFLGKDCMNPKPERPDKGKGHKPKGCENCGKEFPQVTFTNGIDNSLKEVCETIQQMADDLCMEVVGVYNASYKDATPPPRSADENMALLTAGAKGAGTGALDGLKGGLVKALVAGVMTGGVGAVTGLAKDVGKGAAKGALMGAGKEGLKQEAPRRLPQTQDVLRVIDTLQGRSQSRATIRMAEDIANQLRDGQQVNLIGHSEGGVNTVAAIAQAKRKLADEREGEIRDANPGMDAEAARMQANQEVEADMAKNLNVTLLGTQQTGLPDGPKYTRLANDHDLVPDAIAGAQDAVGQKGYDKEPGPPSPDVVHFPDVEKDEEDSFVTRALTVSVNPAAAHSMKYSYIPKMRTKEKGASCC